MLIGLSLLLYPTVSNYWNSLHASQAVASYEEHIQNIEEERFKSIWSQAEEYNQKLSAHKEHFVLTNEEKSIYDSTLNTDGTGIMGYIEIPVIDVSLPIYHGTDSNVLQIAVGHLDWTSLPVGGKNTHCVLSGHRGLPSAKLFSDLDRLVEGDLFTIHVLNEVHTYRVDQIQIIEPANTKPLLLEEGKDLCTLMTCTPYGVNSHRLLVRGHRIENQAEEIRVTSDALQIDPLHVAPFMTALFLVLLFSFVVLNSLKKQVDSRRNISKRNDDDE